MRRSFKSLGVLVLAFLLLAGAMPAGAWGAVTLTHELNWGTFEDGPPYTPGAHFEGPADVAVDKWGNVYVAGGWSGDDRVQMFDADGTFIKVCTEAGSDPGDVVRPYSLATDRFGTMFVAQSGNARVEVFNPQFYNHLRSIGGTGDLISNACGIAVDLDGRIYIARQGLTDVQVRDWFGNIVTLPNPVTGPKPWGTAVSQDGQIYVAHRDPGNAVGSHRSDGSLQFPWAGEPAFDDPTDVGVDGGGNVFAVEFGADRARVLKPFEPGAGATLTTFGSSGSGADQFNDPNGIGVGPDRTVYVADTWNNRVSKWTVSVPTTSVTVAGDNRIKTAVEASKKAYPSPATADIAVIATGFNWPDALGGAALAGAVNGPLLLTNQATLPAEVATELERLQVKRVYVLGGTSAVSDAVLTAAKAHTDLNIATRLAGANRYATAIAIADETKSMLGSDYDGTAFVCTGVNFPDALAASPIAAANGWPIYLTPPDALPADVQASMMRTYGGNPSNHGYIIGGTSAVSAAVETRLAAAPFMGFGRHAGANRYDTAAKVADIGYTGMGMLFSRPAVATGENFPDALAGGVLQGSDCCPVLLTRSGTLSPEAAGMLTKYKDHIYEIRFVGGDGAVKPAVRNAAKALLW